jgi:hypothetical protein
MSKTCLALDDLKTNKLTFFSDGEKVWNYKVQDFKVWNYIVQNYKVRNDF